ncbi:ATP-binding protein [uncultured Lamprocystis sp.]|jgi:CheY-like chemotaxis protein|uniref:hybrid sensor histidine kinase/response regulator n=1 Tax=uncultured Lamprocystis sp. TaxID=543132 RepID=UPI0025DA633D|nr:ATP-binding protein [uncultured Lamprocystis sp.]
MQLRNLKTGALVDVSRHNILIKNPQTGEPWCYATVTRDITARKLAEDALREANRRKEAFIAILAHELRNPLAPIRNAVEMLKLIGSPDPTQQAARDMIDRQVRHLTRLVDDLLDVSRINQGRLQLRREPVALGAVLEQVLEVARPQFARAGHQLTATLPREPIMLEADPVRLAQVFQNLLDNACKYSEQDGAICLTAERAGTQVVVRVADRGIGIAPEDLPRLFELFVQAGAPSGQLPSGLGIGLALCRGLTELHGGTMEAHSAGPGQGSEFSVLLPALPALPAAPVVPADPPAPQPTGPAAPVRVLVVDDNVDSAESLAFLLGAIGYAVTTAHDGLAGGEAAARERPEIVLLDLGMPRLDGYGACRRLREQPWGRAMRIIALTGWGQADDRRRIQEAGFDLHLVKPVELSVLLGVLADTANNKTSSPS